MTGRKRHKATQIAKKPEDADWRLVAGHAIAQVCYALEIGEATYHPAGATSMAA